MSTLRRASRATPGTSVRQRSTSRYSLALNTPGTPAAADSHSTSVSTPAHNPTSSDDDPKETIISKDDYLTILVVSALSSAYSQALEQWIVPSQYSQRINLLVNNFGTETWNSWTESLISSCPATFGTSAGRDILRKQLPNSRGLALGLFKLPRDVEQNLRSEWEAADFRAFGHYLRLTSPDVSLIAAASARTRALASKPPAVSVSPSADSPQMPLRSYSRATPRAARSQSRVPERSPAPADTPARTPARGLGLEAPATSSGAPDAMADDDATAYPLPAADGLDVGSVAQLRKLTVFGHSQAQRQEALALVCGGAAVARVEHKANWAVVTLADAGSAAAILARAGSLALGDSPLGVVPFSPEHDDDRPVVPAILAAADAELPVSVNGQRKNVFATAPEPERRGWFAEFMQRLLA